MIIYCYILIMSDNRHYTGITKNLETRLKQHNAGHSNFTSKYLPVKLIHFEKFKDYKEARRKEKKIKNFGAKRYLIQKKFAANEKSFAAP